jgi:hypothetical protein
MGEENAYKFLVAKHKENKFLGKLGIYGRTVSKWILKKLDEGLYTDLSCSGRGSMAGSCEHSIEPSGSIKYQVITFVSKEIPLHNTHP